jgi:hypothetical protein
MDAGFTGDLGLTASSTDNSFVAFNAFDAV